MEKSATNEFLTILRALHCAGALEQLILVGSWCLPVYRFLYKSDEIPVLRTTDLDFLIENPKKRFPCIDVPSVLEHLGFSTIFDINSNLTKYERHDLEIEFLTTRTRSASPIVPVSNLQLTAQMLSYMEIAKQFVQKTEYNDIPLKIPELEAYVLHKTLVIPLRQDLRKKEKDARTVSSLTALIAEIPSRKDRLLEIFGQFPLSWQKSIRKTASTRLPQLLSLLNESPFST